MNTFYFRRPILKWVDSRDGKAGTHPCERSLWNGFKLAEKTVTYLKLMRYLKFFEKPITKEINKSCSSLTCLIHSKV